MSHGGKRKGAGKKKGSKHKKTLEREAAAEVYGKMVRAELAPLFRKQMLLSMGTIYVYRREHHGTGAARRIENVLLEDPHEIADALDVIANGDDNWPNEDGFVYVSVKASFAWSRRWPFDSKFTSRNFTIRPTIPLYSIW